MMRISLITVCYNAATTLPDTLVSVAGQTLQPYEHIVVDGGSRDGTRDILAAWSRHPLRWSSAPDRGIYDAMNQGLARATGDAVGFLNADDIFADERVLATIATELGSSRADAIFGDLVYVPRDDPRRVMRHWDASGFTPNAFAHGSMPPHPTLYIRRSCIDRFGGFRLDLAMANDFEFCVRYFASHRIRYRHIPKVLVRMRLGGESNRTWSNVMKQNWCIQRALRMHGLTPHPLYPVLKALDKGRQFFRHSPELLA
jgi:glycosyltransferase involved in cell wall biosynthesis